MPSIPELQRNRLASSLVGTPGVDRSGAQAASAVGSLFDAAGSVFSDELSRKREFEDTAQVNRTLIEFELSANQKRMEHQATYTGDPLNKTDALKESLSELVSTYQSKLTSTNARQGFSLLSDRVMRDQLVLEQRHAEEQRVVNAFDDVVSSSEMLSEEAYRRGQNGEGFDRFIDLAEKFKGSAIAARGVLGEEQYLKFIRQGPRSIARAYIDGAGSKDPDGVYSLLRNQMFDDYFDGEELSKIEGEVLQKFDQAQKRAEDALDNLQSKEAFDMFSRLATGENPPSLAEVREAVDMGRLDPDKGETLMKSVLNPPAIESDAFVIADLNNKLINGELNLETVLKARGQLAQEATTFYIDVITKNLSSNPAVKRAIRSWDALIEKDNLFGFRRPDQAEEFNQGVEQILTRSANGKENPFDVFDELKQSKKQRQRAEMLSGYKAQYVASFGDKITENKMTKAKDELYRKFSARAITEEEFNDKAAILEELAKLEED